MKSKLALSLAAIMLAISSPAGAQEELTLDELLERFGWNFDTAEITTEKIDDGLYVLFGMGGNIGVSIGEQGVLVVDDMFPERIGSSKPLFASGKRGRFNRWPQHDRLHHLKRGRWRDETSGPIGF
ncbi:MAG: hypothetical protein VCC04_01035 [Myxococcota bacterium]